VLVVVVAAVVSVNIYGSGMKREIKKGKSAEAHEVPHMKREKFSIESEKVSTIFSDLSIC